MHTKGQCQCGTCRYTVDAKPFVAYTCHCTECQKLSASAFTSLMQVPAESVTVTSGSPTNKDRTTETGNVLKTWFCARCGSVLFAENSARPRVRSVHIGTLDDVQNIAVNAHIWVKRKLPWVNLPEGHRIFDEAGDWTEDYANDPTRYHS